MQAREIEPKLKQLIEDTRKVEPKLSARLDEFRRWIKGKRIGLLSSKRYVLDFLQELIIDVNIWLRIQILPHKEKQVIFAEMNLPEIYWYDFLFSKWFNESDPHSTIWKQKMMGEKFTQADKLTIENLKRQIVGQSGSSLTRYIIDLSMATDIIASSSSQIPLCIQLTTGYDDLLENKKIQWELILKYWGIKRGLFISYDPRLENSLCNVILDRCDNLPDCGYNYHSINP